MIPSRARFACFALVIGWPMLGRAADSCPGGRDWVLVNGTILTMEGNGPEAKLTVYFDRAGSKKFIAKYAKLTRI
jgi:hypothetical protein